jgi:hypothetical protein
MLITTREIASQLGISPRRIRQLAKSRKVGSQLSDDTWVFTIDDLEKLKYRVSGRPAKTLKKIKG